jgi:hypothetical protein
MVLTSNSQGQARFVRLDKLFDCPHCANEGNFAAFDAHFRKGQGLSEEDG